MPCVLRKAGDQISSEDENFITSHFQFTFDIENFALLKEKGGIIHSPNFSGDSKYGDQWRVQFTHKTEDSANGSLQLVHSKSKEEIDAKFQMCILDASKTVKCAVHLQKETFLQGRENQGQHQPLFAISRLLDPQNGFLVDDCLRFYIQVSTHRLKSKEQPQPEPAPETQRVLQLDAEKLKSFLDKENFADVVLMTSGKSRFPASKLILAAQSPVFFVMFNSEMLESKSNAVVKIGDFSDEAIKGFLEFLYTGKLESLKENVGELFIVSDKYQVLSLKTKCEKLLLKSLSVENAVYILILAHLHSPENLKPKIIKFVNKNFNSLKPTESYKEMKKKYPEIICDLYENSMK